MCGRDDGCTSMSCGSVMRSHVCTCDMPPISVVIGAPWSPTRQQLQQLGVTIFARGTQNDYTKLSERHITEANVAATELGILRTFESKHAELTTATIIRRILMNRELGVHVGGC